MKIVIIGAGSDLGIHIDGSSKGPIQLINDIKSFYKEEVTLLNQDSLYIKSRSLADKRKNEFELEKFNAALYQIANKYIENEYFKIIIGGDHSVTIASSLANSNKKGPIGLICFSSHSSYHTFETTTTGNISELANATINGYNNAELRDYHSTSTILARNTVIIGPSVISRQEKENIRYAGATIYTEEILKTRPLEEIINEAISIASEKTNGIHIIFNLDFISSTYSTGVSTPTENTITEDTAYKTLDLILKQISKITSFDLVGFNPTTDTSRKTEQIAVNILAKTIVTAQKK